MSALWQDIEANLVAWLESDAWPNVVADTVTGDLSARTAGALRFVRVTKIGGPTNDVTAFDRVDIETFDTTRAGAMLLAREINAALVPRLRIGSATIDSVRTDASPHSVPWDNVNIRRVLASYQISSRKGRLS